MTSPTALQTGTSLGFGTHFTDHMASARWDRERGWTTGEISRSRDLILSPAAMVLHYGQAIFEGLKAFAQPDGGVALFRPDAGADRMRRSAQRMAMPELPAETFVAACVDLVRADRESVPTAPGTSLYLRPFMLATEAQLGVRAAHEFLFLVIAGPVEPFFSLEPTPISVFTSTEFSRAAAGGVGAAKCAGNYAASLLGRERARANGHDEMLWLDSISHEWIEELSGMNVFFVVRDSDEERLVTPMLTDTILAGITRDSILRLARDAGIPVEERRVSLEEIKHRSAEGTLSEAFACGTAAVVAPIGTIGDASGSYRTGAGTQPGRLTLRLRGQLTDLQTGVTPDPYKWRVEV